MFGFKNKMSSLDIKDVVTTAREFSRWTPDLCILQQHAHHALFVFDRLKSGHFEFDQMILPASYGGATAFSDEKFVMFKRDLSKDSYPIIQRKDYIRNPPLRIKGELYWVETEQYKELDKFKENGVQFHRELIDIIIPHTQQIKFPHWKEGGRSQAEHKAIMDTECRIHKFSAMKIMRAYAYIAIDDYWDPLVTDDMFSTVGTYEAHNKEVGLYYDFKLKRVLRE